MCVETAPGMCVLKLSPKKKCFDHRGRKLKINEGLDVMEMTKNKMFKKNVLSSNVFSLLKVWVERQCHDKTVFTKLMLKCAC